MTWLQRIKLDPEIAQLQTLEFNETEHNRYKGEIGPDSFHYAMGIQKEPDIGSTWKAQEAVQNWKGAWKLSDIDRN